ncbi:MAG: hypothetical protein OHK0021_01400 [Bryobacter sp.]
MSGEGPPEKLQFTSRKERLLAGLQAGTLAFLTSLLWLLLVSGLEGRSIWTYPNLLACVFSGVDSFRPQFSEQTPAGLSIHFLSCSLTGVFASQVIGLRTRAAASLGIGILLATAGYYLVDFLIWRNWLPVFAVYSRRLPIFFSHVLVGLCVGLYSIFVRRDVALNGRI